MPAYNCPRCFLPTQPLSDWEVWQHLAGHCDMGRYFCTACREFVGRGEDTDRHLVGCGQPGVGEWRRRTREGRRNNGREVERVEGGGKEKQASLKKSIGEEKVQKVNNGGVEETIRKVKKKDNKNRKRLRKKRPQKRRRRNRMLKTDSN